MIDSLPTGWLQRKTEPNGKKALPMICLELSSVSEVDEDEMSAPAETDDERFASMLNEFRGIALKCAAFYDLNYEKITGNNN